MNKLTVLQMLEKIKKPLPILLTVTCVGMLLNLSIFSYKYLPAMQQQFLFSQQYDQVERQLKSIEATPVPAKATAKDMESLVNQIPTKDEISRFIVSLKNIEASTGATLKTIAMGSGKETRKDELNGIINGQLKKGQNQSPNQSPAPPAVGVPAKNGPLMFEETMLMVTINGSYAQVIDFFNKVYQLDRVVNAATWDIEPIASDSTNTSQKQSDDLKIQAKLSVVVYSAKQYAGKFPDLPAITTDSFEPKAAPMLSEEKYLKMLDSSNQAKTKLPEQ
jgi:Tfp pilus assembly protein PilO